MRLIAAIPKLASLDIQRSISFFTRLGFSSLAAYPDYGVVEWDGIQIHFWRCDDPQLPKATGCRINVEGIEELFKHYSSLGVIHPNGALEKKPWGFTEFSVLDVDGNLITFAER
ncbi:MAG: VOC family protein [Rhodocyclaceae bacterium]|nr:VOC family protein [Rhodocyclaceae bacterium]